MRRRVGGYLTIELTLLLPMIIMVFLLLTEAGLYFYNRCLLRENAQILALQLAEEAETLTEEGLADHISGLAQNKYLLLRELQTSYRKEGGEIWITVSGNMYNFCSVAGIGDACLTLTEEAVCQTMDKTAILGTIRAVKRKIDANRKGEDS
ncbi:MAG: pilus assembly protein [Lachnospiraceae bacterium]|nr:pilus assembly protein [Lachnospiraceae bacterium]